MAFWLADAALVTALSCMAGTILKKRVSWTSIMDRSNSPCFSRGYSIVMTPMQLGGQAAIASERAVAVWLLSCEYPGKHRVEAAFAVHEHLSVECCSKQLATLNLFAV